MFMVVYVSERCLSICIYTLSYIYDIIVCVDINVCVCANESVDVSVFTHKQYVSV